METIQEVIKLSKHIYKSSVNKINQDIGIYLKILGHKD